MENSYVDFDVINSKLQEKLELKKNNLNLAELGLFTLANSIVDKYKNSWEKYTNLKDYRINLTDDTLQAIINNYNPDLTSLLLKFIDNCSIVLLLTFYENGNWVGRKVKNLMRAELENIIVVDFKGYVITNLYAKEKESFKESN